MKFISSVKYSLFFGFSTLFLFTGCSQKNYSDDYMKFYKDTKNSKINIASNQPACNRGIMDGTAPISSPFVRRTENGISVPSKTAKWIFLKSAVLPINIGRKFQIIFRLLDWGNILLCPIMCMGLL